MKYRYTRKQIFNTVERYIGTVITAQTVLNLKAFLLALADRPKEECKNCGGKKFVFANGLGQDSEPCVFCNPISSPTKAKIEKITQKLWMTVSWDDSPTTFQWMVEIDLNKSFKFVKMSNGRIGFTQVNNLNKE